MRHALPSLQHHLPCLPHLASRHALSPQLQPMVILLGLYLSASNHDRHCLIHLDCCSMLGHLRVLAVDHYTDRSQCLDQACRKGHAYCPARITIIRYFDTSNMQPVALSFGGVQSSPDNHVRWALLAAAATTTAPYMKLAVRCDLRTRSRTLLVFV
jgi:hypothetical protein